MENKKITPISSSDKPPIVTYDDGDIYVKVAIGTLLLIGMIPLAYKSL